MPKQTNDKQINPIICFMFGPPFVHSMSTELLWFQIPTNAIGNRMQAIFWMLQQLGQNAARPEMMSPPRCLSGFGLLISSKQESERLAARRSARVDLQCEI